MLNGHPAQRTHYARRTRRGIALLVIDSTRLEDVCVDIGGK